MVIEAGTHSVQQGAEKGDVVIGYVPFSPTADLVPVGPDATLRRGTIVYAGSRIGSRVQTGHRVTIHANSTIGDDVSIWTGSVIADGCWIGNRAKIHSNCYVAPSSVIGDDAFLAPGVVLAPGIVPGAEPGERYVGARIESGAQVGVNATILAGVTIGAGAIIGAGAVVTQDIPPRAVAYGNPAAVVGTRDELGDVATKVRARAGRARRHGPMSVVGAAPAPETTVIGGIDPTTDGIWSELTSARGSVFTTPTWLDTIVDTYGFDIEASAIVDSDGQPVAGLACATVRDFRGDQLISLPFSDYSDPIVTTSAQWDRLIGPFLERGLPFRIRVRDVNFVRDDHRFNRIDTLAWHGTDLGGDEADILARCQPQFRQAVRAAQRHGVDVRFGNDIDDLRAFYALHRHTRMVKYELLPQPWTFFENMWKRFAPLDRMTVGLATHDGDVIAGALYLIDKEVMYYKFGASIPERLRTRPNELLAWRSMQFGREHGCTSYDWGVSDIDQPGLIRYKRKCATDERVVSVLRHVPAGYTVPRAADDASSALHELARVLTREDVPADVANTAAELLYRFFA